MCWKTLWSSRKFSLFVLIPVTDSTGHSAWNGVWYWCCWKVDFCTAVYVLETHGTKLTQVYSKHGEEGYSDSLMEYNKYVRKRFGVPQKRSKLWGREEILLSWTEAPWLQTLPVLLTDISQKADLLLDSGSCDKGDGRKMFNLNKVILLK